MIKNTITKYQISEHIALKVIKAKIIGVTVKSTCYLTDVEGNMIKII